MIKIKVTCKAGLVGNFSRMVPDGRIIDNVRFYFEDEGQNIEYDYWLVLHASGLQNIETSMCAKERMIYVSFEADERISGAVKKFLSQFQVVFSCDDKLKNPVKVNLSLQHWWVGMKVKFKNGSHVISKDCSMNYHSLSEPVKVPKLDRISIILSNRDVTPGHSRRRAYVDKLLESRVGGLIDIYGPDFKPVEDKWDALVQYKYHISIENMVKDNYWTEKLVDPMLAECLTFYLGCPNILDYFPKGSCIPINYEDDIEGAVLLIEQALENGLYEKNLSSLLKGKHAALNDNNLFFVIARHCNKVLDTKKLITLYPNSLLSNPFKYVAKQLLVFCGIHRN
jgi:hypothetical protein